MGTPTVAVCDASEEDARTRIRRDESRGVGLSARFNLRRDLHGRTGRRYADAATGDVAEALANIDTSAARDAVCAFPTWRTEGWCRSETNHTDPEILVTEEFSDANAVE